MIHLAGVVDGRSIIKLDSLAVDRGCAVGLFETCNLYGVSREESTNHKALPQEFPGNNVYKEVRLSVNYIPTHQLAR